MIFVKIFFGKCQLAGAAVNAILCYQI